MAPNWAAANGGVTNGGLRGVWPPFLKIGRNQPFLPFFCLFRPFPEGTKSTWEIQKTEEKGLFPQISSDLLKPPSLKPPFAALQPNEYTNNSETILRARHNQNLVVKFDGEICGGVLVENVSDDFPSRRSSNISFQTSPEVRHQFRQKLRQLHSGNRGCLQLDSFRVTDAKSAIGRDHFPENPCV